MPASSAVRVDLPAPLGPVTATHSPARTPALTSARACTVIAGRFADITEARDWRMTETDSAATSSASQESPEDLGVIGLGDLPGSPAPPGSSELPGSPDAPGSPVAGSEPGPAQGRAGAHSTRATSSRRGAGTPGT